MNLVVREDKLQTYLCSMTKEHATVTPYKIKTSFPDL